jgi:hypothetical protein
MNEKRLVPHRTQIAGYGRDLFRICDVEFEKTTELQRQVCGAFLFGVTNAHGMMHKLSPPDVHALAISMLMDVLNYSPEQAGAFSSNLIDATAAGPDDTMNAIIHRGIDGHLQLTSGQQDGLRVNLLEIFEILGDPYTA